MNDVQVFAQASLPSRSRLHRSSRRKAILVVGMSRSGTSLTTHVLNALGASLPAELLAPDFGNPLGFWEPSRLVALNHEILATIERSIDDPRPIDPRWFRSRAGYEAVKQIALAIRSLYPEDALFAIKDPRLCRLLPLYLEALDILDIEPLIVLQVRHAAEAAESLLNMEGLDPAHGQFLWLRSLVDAELHSRPCPRVWVSFDDLLGNWRDTVERMADHFALRWPLNPDEVAPAIDRIIKPRQRHARYGGTASVSLHPLIAETWEAVSKGVRGCEQAARDGFDAVRSAMQEMDRLYLPASSWLIDRHLRALTMVHASTCWRITAPLRLFKLAVIKAMRAGGIGLARDLPLRWIRRPV